VDHNRRKYAGDLHGVVNLVTFVDERFPTVASRFLRQARKFGELNSVKILSERSLTSEFQTRHRAVLRAEVKGFGYYCWKPQIIAQELETIRDGEILAYVDAGSHLKRSGLGRWNDYIDICTASDSGILAFQTDRVEKEWTKGDVIDHFGVRNRREIIDSGQIQAGLVFIVNSAQTRRFVAEWKETFEQNFSLIDGSPSKSPNLPGFIRHRHDQSIFSVLAKSRNVTLLSAVEQDGDGTPQAVGLPFKFPVHHKRDMPGHPSRRLRVRLRNARRSIDELVKRLDPHR